MNYIIASSHKNYSSLHEELNLITKDTFYCISDKKALNIPFINKIKPKYIFFPHWSYIIPKDIYLKYTCIMFHMTDLPFGRGGTPMQNLITRGIYETKITVFRCADGIDTGPIYLKKPFYLYGSGDDIFFRLRKVVKELILIIIQNELNPIPQKGRVRKFKRRTPNDGNMSRLKSLDKLYDYIRMLDVEDYPHSFIETKYFRFEFTRATIKTNKIVADVTIYEK
jgi:methionyl-tRNA formyltransferase